jgi:hypothetical protein
MEKYCVLFEVGTECLNIPQMSFRGLNFIIQKQGFGRKI